MIINMNLLVDGKREILRWCMTGTRTFYRQIRLLMLKTLPRSNRIILYELARTSSPAKSAEDTDAFTRCKW